MSGTDKRRAFLDGLAAESENTTQPTPTNGIDIMAVAVKYAEVTKHGLGRVVSDDPCDDARIMATTELTHFGNPAPTQPREVVHEGLVRRVRVNHWRTSSSQSGTQITDEDIGSLGADDHGSSRANSAGGHRAAADDDDDSIRSQLSNLALLVLLYLLQGIPMGLTMGAMPFMLSSRMSYAQMGTFSLAAAPYSLKLLWSPVVDCLYSVRLGRRKTWIVPLQFSTALLLLTCSHWISQLYEAADVNTLTAVFFVIVLLAATQDIAVDGWALTLLPSRHLAWAATCQTLGTSTGFFTSFTVFLALQDADFCNRYIRSSTILQRTVGLSAFSPLPLVDLESYLRFWGMFFLIVTALLWLLKPESSTGGCDSSRQRASFPADDSDCTDKAAGSFRLALHRVRDAYAALWSVLRLRAVWGMIALLLTHRLGVLTAESAASLKLLEKGVSKETLAVLVLVQFPVELVSALVAGRWAAKASPSTPFLVSYFLRLLTNLITVALVAAFTHGAGTLALTSRPFLLLAAVSVLSSAVSSLAFTALGTVFNSISDPNMGGAYLTLLNTVSNLGVTLPKTPAFYLMEALTKVQCQPPSTAPTTHPWGADVDDTAAAAETLAALQCPSRPGDVHSPSACRDAGGECVVVRDGFFLVCWASIAIGVALGLVYVRCLPGLLSLPLSAWHIQQKQQQPDTELSTALGCTPGGTDRSGQKQAKQH